MRNKPLDIVRRIRLEFVKGVEVEFADRELAIRQIYEWAEKGMRFPQVIFGPEGCGKTAWLRQSAEILRELGFEVIYINPLERSFYAEIGVEDVRRKLLDMLMETTEAAWAKAVSALIMLVRELIEDGKKKIAVLVDDAFQVIGLDKAAIYVKGLLGLIEYPPRSYDNIVAIVATSEGLSRREIGRHDWADVWPIWNMPRKGFRQLYEQLPGNKPDFEEAWRLTGGNPRVLADIYQSHWDVDRAIERLMTRKDITPRLTRRWGTWLEKAINDPDVLWTEDAPEELINELISRNLIIYNLYERNQGLWIDEPPPEKDLELGIGRYVAWQSPIHREAIRRALEQVR